MSALFTVFVKKFIFVKKFMALWYITAFGVIFVAQIIWGIMTAVTGFVVAFV